MDMNDKQKIDELEARLSLMETKLDRMIHGQHRWQTALADFLPEQTRDHIKALRKERILVIRSLLDHCLEQESESGPKSRQGSARDIPID